ncbi:MAG: hypothetical protein A2381_15305 [Bdellovibrionales bacterium RIFOXYB1_FULL_37_110]|nr:MAG: hypothetical protein A2381_15305 [Bdellovibrionales bacterium RIFOXYB1_FULL_37_110]
MPLEDNENLAMELVRVADVIQISISYLTRLVESLVAQNPSDRSRNEGDAILKMINENKDALAEGVAAIYSKYWSPEVMQAAIDWNNSASCMEMKAKTAVVSAEVEQLSGVWMQQIVASVLGSDGNQTLDTLN